MLRKNTASQYVYFALVNATTGAALTGATVTGRRILDGAAAAIGATITEPNSDGFYQAALTQADTNANDIGYFFTATNAVPVGFTITTTACNPTSTDFGLSLAKTTNITGFNDIAATAIVSAGAITTSGGAVSTVTTVTNQLTAAEVATGVWQDATAGDFTVASSIGKSLYTTGNAPGAASGIALVGSNMGTVSSVTGAVGSVTGAVGSVTGSVGSVAAGGIAAASFAANAIDSGALAASAAAEIADKVLGRNVAGGADGTRTVSEALYVLRNKTDIAAGTLTVYGTDDATPAFTAAVTTTAGDPISQIDPA